MLSRSISGAKKYEEASQSYDPAGIPYIEQDIRRATHIQRAMRMFFSLRDGQGRALVTAMLPAAKQSDLDIPSGCRRAGGERRQP